MFSLFRRNARQAKPARRTPRSYRPRLEVLEDRLTPTAGLLDPTFGAGTGYVLSSFSSSGSESNAVVVQSDGKVVIAGSGGFLVARYNADGSLDTSFGSGGHAPPPNGVGARAVAIQSDGKILAAGSVFNNGTDHFALARYNANGTLDTTFGNQGEVVTSLGGTPEYATTMAVQADGKILVGGYTDAPGPYVAALVRYNANGTLDTTFGNGGKLITNIQTYNTPVSLVIQPDGKIVLAGTSRDPTSGYEADMVARFNANGTTDSSFGTGGEVITHVGSLSDGFGGVALQADGKIVVSSDGDISGSGDLCLIRYNADGTLDATFGTSGNGIVTIAPPAGDFAQAYHTGVEVQSDGKIIGTAQLETPSTYVAGAARVNADGTLDTSYSNGGWATVPIGFQDRPAASVLQPDGRLLIVGYEKPTSNSGFSNALLIRFTGDTTTASFSVTGFPSSVTAGAAGTLTVTALNPDGSTNTGYTGTVHFTSSDPHAVLPADYTFTTADQGVHTFSATLVTAGSQSITATDTTTSTMIGSDFGIVVQPAAASQFILSAPSSIKRGSAFSVTLTVEDAFGNVVTGYVGTVHFRSSDSTATLPADYTFMAGDAGVHTFTSAFALRKRGTQTITVTDTQNSALAATDSINVT